MIKRLKDNMSLTLVEVLVAMLILSSSTAGVLGSFSYAYKFIIRAGKKIEAMNYGRKAQDAYRAIWLCSASDARLNTTTGAVVNGPTVNSIDTSVSNPWFAPDYDGVVNVIITNWPSGSSTGKQINIKVGWDAS